MMGSGPSLIEQKDLLPRLAEEDTWTVNRMKYSKDLLGFIPTHHSVVEPSPIGNWGRVILPNYDFPDAQNRIAVHWFPVTAPGWLWAAKAHDDIQMRWQGFQGLGDHLPPVPTGWAAPITSAQIAAWLGYTEFIFLGIDTTQTGQAWDKVGGRTKVKRSIDTIIECADRMKHDIQRAGRTIFDCTPGGLLNEVGALPYKPLEEVLNGSDKA